VVPLAEHPSNPNGVIVYDLSVDPSELLSMSAEQIRERVFVSQQDLSEGETRIPLKVIHINRCPVVFPATALKDVDGPHKGEYGDIVARLGLDVAACRAHWKMLREASGVTQKVAEVFSAGYDDAPQDPDLMLYAGSFFSAADRKQMERVRAMDPWDLVGERFAFQDPRLEEMLFRFRARSYPETLEGDELEQWEGFRWMRINDATLSGFTLKAFAREIEHYNQQTLTDHQRQVLEELVLYVEAMLPAQAFDA